MVARQQHDTARHSLLLVVLALAAAEVISWTGVMPAAHDAWLTALRSFFSGQFGFMSAAAAGYTILTWQLPIARTLRLGIMVCGTVLGLLLSSQGAQGPITQLNCLMAGLGSASFAGVSCYLLGHRNTGTHPAMKCYFMEVSAIVLFILASSFYLKLTIVLRPDTFDTQMLVWDALLFGGQPSIQASLLAASLPGSLTVLKLTYLFLPMLMIVMKFMGEGRQVPVNITGAFLGTAALGYSLYFIAPVCGPLYLLGENFPLNPPSLAQTLSNPHLPLAWPDYPRNGIPSLHMSWALSLAFMSVYLGGAARLWAGVTLVLTFCATLALGEHYVIDLIIALPFSVLIQALFTRVPISARRKRRNIIILCALSTLLSVAVALLPGYSLLFSPLPWWAFWAGMMALSLKAFGALRNAASHD